MGNSPVEIYTLLLFMIQLLYHKCQPFHAGARAWGV
jgi:hypothetical protein